MAKEIKYGIEARKALEAGQGDSAMIKEEVTAEDIADVVHGGQGYRSTRCCKANVTNCFIWSKNYICVW